MKFIAVALLFCSTLVNGQKISYPRPSIPHEGKSIYNFIPKGWALLDSAAGDLNKDGVKDYALVLQTKDSVTYLRTDRGGDTNTVTAQPRMLVILFADSGTGKYKLAEQDNSFIPVHDDPYMQDPFTGVSISKGVLKISIGIFMNAGGWTASNNTYLFRYQNNGFALIGADYFSLNRATGDTEEYSFNFLTGKYSHTTAQVSPEKHPPVEWYTLKLKELKTLKTLVEPYTWTVVSGVEL